MRCSLHILGLKLIKAFVSISQFSYTAIHHDFFVYQLKGLTFWKRHEKPVYDEEYEMEQLEEVHKKSLPTEEKDSAKEKGWESILISVVSILISIASILSSVAEILSSAE